MTMILWATAAAIFFAVTNAISYKQGKDVGCKKGYRSAAKLKVKQETNGDWTIDWGEEE